MSPASNVNFATTKLYQTEQMISFLSSFLSSSGKQQQPCPVENGESFRGCSCQKGRSCHRLLMKHFKRPEAAGRPRAQGLARWAGRKARGMGFALFPDVGDTTLSSPGWVPRLLLLFLMLLLSLLLFDVCLASGIRPLSDGTPNMAGL